MIIVTSNLVEHSWETVYGVYLLAETDISIPWYVKKWGLNYYNPPEHFPTSEGVYGFPLSPELHRLRVCLQGERWMESLSPSTYEILLSIFKSKNLVRYIGSTVLHEQEILNLFGIGPLA